LDASRNLSGIHLLEVIQSGKGFTLPVTLTFRYTGDAFKIRNEHLNMTQASVHKPSNLLVQGKRATLGFLLGIIPVGWNRIREGIFIVKNGMPLFESLPLLLCELVQLQLDPQGVIVCGAKGKKSPADGFWDDESANSIAPRMFDLPWLFGPNRTIRGWH
jgi:hypothetical protein